MGKTDPPPGAGAGAPSKVLSASARAAALGKQWAEKSRRLRTVRRGNSLVGSSPAVAARSGTLDPHDDSDESMDTGVDSGSKALVHKIFDVDRGDLMALAAGYGKKYDYRGVLEPTAAKAQCDKVIGKFEADTLCYLCGLEIPTIVGKTSSHELYPECEHILPVTEARWYLDLYMSRPTTELGEWASERLRLEYAYAHRVCNQAKSNFSFVKPIGINLQTSDQGFLRILTNIRNRAAKAVKSGDYVGKDAEVLVRIRDTILKRGPTIREEKINPILAHTARKQDEAAINILARVAKLIDMSNAKKEVQRAYDDYSGPSHEEKEDMKLALIAQMYDANPLLEENKVRTSLKARFPELSDLIDRVVTRILVDTILSNYLTVVAGRKSRVADSGGVESESEPLGVHLTQIVLYGAYLAVFDAFRQDIENKKISLNDTNANTLCSLYNTLGVFFEIEELKTVLSTIVKPMPPATNAVKIACGKAGRAERAAARLNAEQVKDDEDDEDDEEEPLTDEQALTYYFSDLSDRLALAGVSADDADKAAGYIKGQYMEYPFKPADPLAGVREQIEAIVAAVSLTYGPDVGEKVRSVLETLGNEGYATEADVLRMQAAGGGTPDKDGDISMSNAAAEPAGAGAGAGAGSQTGKRIGGRRPLYG